MPLFRSFLIHVRCVQLWVDGGITQQDGEGVGGCFSGSSYTFIVVAGFTYPIEWQTNERTKMNHSKNITNVCRIGDPPYTYRVRILYSDGPRSRFQVGVGIAWKLVLVSRTMGPCWVVLEWLSILRGCTMKMIGYALSLILVRHIYLRLKLCVLIKTCTVQRDDYAVQFSRIFASTCVISLSQSSPCTVALLDLLRHNSGG